MENHAARCRCIKGLKSKGFNFTDFIYFEAIFAVILQAIWNLYLLLYSFLVMLQ